MFCLALTTMFLARFVNQGCKQLSEKKSKQIITNESMQLQSILQDPQVSESKAIIDIINFFSPNLFFFFKIKLEAPEAYIISPTI